MVLVLGLARCDECRCELPEASDGAGAEGVVGEVIGDRYRIVCSRCFSAPFNGDVASHLFVVEPDPCDDRVPAWEDDVA